MNRAPSHADPSATEVGDATAGAPVGPPSTAQPDRPAPPGPPARPPRSARPAPPATQPPSRLVAVRETAPGLLVAAVGVALALGLHRLVPAVGVLTWSVLAGAVAANTGLLPGVAGSGLRFAARRLLRLGVVLLGLSLPLGAVAALGLPVVAMVVATVAVTWLATWWLGRLVGLGQPRSLLLATGFSICGASAVAAVQDAAEADEDDVATAIAMVTVCGTAAMVAVPLLQGPLGLGGEQLGAWAGAGVHEVGQVVAAAGPAGTTAVAIAVVVKLTRVLMLAPVVAAVSLARGRNGRTPGRRRPPLVPLFVLGFLGCVVLRSLDLVPETALAVVAEVQVVTLAAALVALGAGVRLDRLLRGGGRALAVATGSTLIIGGLSLAWVLWLVP